MDKRKTLVIALAVAAGLVALILGALVFIAPNGGTPIIIKGFGDPGGDYMEIETQPDQTGVLAESHSQSGRVEGLYVIGGQNYDWCVYYDLPWFISSPQINVSVQGAPNEVQVFDSYFSGVDVLFTNLRYTQVGYKYTSNNKLMLESVVIKLKDLGLTNCYDHGGNSIKPCPTEFSSPAYNLSKLAIFVNSGSMNCKPPAPAPTPTPTPAPSPSPG